MSDVARDVYGLGRPASRAIAWFPGLSSLVLGLMLAIPATHARAAGMLKEDRLVENLTVVAYAAAVVFAWGWAARASGPRRLGNATLGFVCFVLGMEEISWGERWLHFRIPDLILRHNVQHEPTLHNLEPFHDASVWVPVALALAALAAILAHTRPRHDATGVPSPLLPWCAVVVLLSGYDNLTAWMPINATFDTLVGMLGEHVEMLVAFAFTIGIGLSMRRERLRAAHAAPPPARPRTE